MPQRLQIIVYATPRDVTYLFSAPDWLGRDLDLHSEHIAGVGRERDPVVEHVDGPPLPGMWVWDGVVEIFEEGHERGPEFAGMWRKLALDEMALTCSGRDWPDPGADALPMGTCAP